MRGKGKRRAGRLKVRKEVKGEWESLVKVGEQTGLHPTDLLWLRLRLLSGPEACGQPASSSRNLPTAPTTCCACGL